MVGAECAAFMELDRPGSR